MSSSTPVLRGSAPYRGHEGLRKWHRDLEETWGDDIRTEPEAFFDLGEYTLTLSVLRGRGRHSGVEVETADVLVARCATASSST
jgi:hypothetical protein